MKCTTDPIADLLFVLVIAALFFCWKELRLLREGDFVLFRREPLQEKKPKSRRSFASADWKPRRKL